MFNSLENGKLNPSVAALCLSGFGPVFLILSVKGLDTSEFSKCASMIYTIIMALFVIMPSAWILILSRFRGPRHCESIEWQYQSFKKADEHVYAYLLTLVFPLMAPTISTMCDLVAVILMVAIAVVVYYRANLYYANIWALMFGYSVHIMHLTEKNSNNARQIVFISPIDTPMPTPPNIARVYHLAGPIYIKVK